MTSCGESTRTRRGGVHRTEGGHVLAWNAFRHFGPVLRLDLAVDSPAAWATRAGGTFPMPTAPHAVTQRWARAIVEAFPDLDGVHYNSRFAGKPCVALFAPARTAMPAQPLVSLTLTDPDVGGRLAATARRTGYQVI